jgi:hypothetical protein
VLESNAMAALNAVIGNLEPVGHFVRIKPRRDPAGRLVSPARVWITPAAHPEPAPAGTAAVLPILGGNPRSLRIGDVLQLTDLREAVQFADMVALSFVRTPQDVLTLGDQLRELGAQNVGIVLKVEAGRSA